MFIIHIKIHIPMCIFSNFILLFLKAKPMATAEAGTPYYMSPE